MGRKAIDRERKPLTDRAKKWVRELTPRLQDKDLSKLTLDELAELAGKSKSTIYTYFSTKEEIFLTITQLVLDDLRGGILSGEVSGNDMGEALSDILLSIGKGIEGISIGYLEQLQKYFPDIWSVIQVYTEEVLTVLAMIYEKGMTEGTFKKFNVSLLTALDRHFVMNIMTDASRFSQQGMSLKDLVQEYLEMRLSALR
ncbi:MAG: TetR/AcrR family transcriptional regulator [Flavobacteriales bacterium]|nr:TetR/AcrR family transcriptional regulator [Flavobacteriales bacterium]